MPPITLALPDDFPVSPCVVEVGDKDNHVVFACVHNKTNTSEIEYAAAYLVDAARTTATLIGRDDLAAKTSGADVLLLPGTAPDRQTVELWVTEASTPGGPGSSNVVHVYTFENAVPGRTPLQAVDGAARQQANAATKMAAAALKGVDEAKASGTDAVKALAADLVAAASEHD